MFETAGLRVIVGLTTALPIIALSYKDGPPLGHTGGFGEPTCQACHFEGLLNSPEANARLVGLPNAFAADSTYLLTVAVSRRELGAGGFSMSSRFRDGRQAGTLRAVDERAVVRSDSSGVMYAMHTLTGTEPISPDSIGWVLQWIAPHDADTVFFHLAANAANGDDSEFGDLIETREARSLPAPN